jgi:hypothetical protein
MSDSNARPKSLGSDGYTIVNSLEKQIFKLLL